MNELQEMLLTLLREVDKICKKHQITYYLCGGSVIGALRHRGFIPWDDDLDICMTRENWRKFASVIDQEMAPNRELISCRRNKSHHKITIKYMNKETSTVFLSQVADYEGCGLSIDVMTLDPIPAACPEQRIQEWLIYNELLTPCFVVNPKIIPYLPQYKRYRALTKVIGKQRVLDRLYHKIYVEDVPDDFTQYIYGWGEQLLVYDRALFGTPQLVPFEGELFPIPEKAYEYCAKTYGDNWYQVPAVENQETHNTVMNLHLSYNNLIGDYRRFLDKERLIKCFAHRKRLWIKRLPYEADNRKEKWLVQAAVLQSRYQKWFDDRKDSLGQLYRDKYYSVLTEVFGDYIKKQLNRSMRANGLYWDIGDEHLEIVLNTLCMSGGYDKAQKLLTLRRGTEKPLSEGLKQSAALIRTSVALTAAMNTSDLKTVKTIYEQSPAYQDAHLDFIRAKVYLMVRENTPSEAFAQMEQKVLSLLEQYPAAGELRKSYGDILWAMDRKEEAGDQYRLAKKQERNGFDWLEIDEKLGALEGTERIKDIGEQKNG
ncbi:LicD family protein [Massiliimalia massiliensis]|uniref:LicD family protein n=1 Tax=Massiliimalia massiliensis TaxID=1852384 RepID=UPI0009847DD0|nr:LicD family protein [Massiliimalia massiliensis]